MKALFSILALALVVVAPIDADAQNKKKPKKSEKQLKSSLHSVNAKKNALQAKIKSTKRQANMVIADIEKADRQLGVLENRLDKTADTLKSSIVRQETLRRELIEVADQLKAKRVLAGKRMRAIFINTDEANPLDLFLATDLGDLAVRKSVMERIARRDKELFETVKRLHEAAKSRKTEQDTVVKRIASLISEQKRDQNDLQYHRGLKTGYLGELKAEQNNLRQQYAVLDRESDTLAAQISAFQVARGGSNVKYGGGIMLWPANGPQTSPFGYRFHPVLKYRRLHAGIDIGAPYGSVVKAAASGTVILANYSGGYGNRVVIDHGSGISTLYGHMSRLGVSSGQTVTKGQRIGNIGSTGISTGPHLHFEVRINGKPVNPRKYL